MNTASAVQHTCTKCGRPIYSPESIARGMGAVCAGLATSMSGRCYETADLVIDWNTLPTPTAEEIREEEEERLANFHEEDDAIFEAPKGLQLHDLSPDQHAAYNQITEWAHYNYSSQPILTVGGYAGTGKSELLGVFAREGGIDNIAFCAYTGRASSVLRGKLMRGGISTRGRVLKGANENLPAGYYETDSTFQGKPYCGTIHSLIYKPIVNERTGRIDRWERRDELDAPYKLLVLDEASMVSDEMLDDLSSYGIQILAVGDHGQLPPVGGLGSLMQDPHIRLEKIHRQAENNPIIALSAEIRNTGRINRKFADGQHIFFDTIPHLRHLLGKRYRGLAGAELFKLATLCYTNRRRAGTNLLTRTVLGLNGPPKVGEQVMCLRNQRDKNIYNGMRGLITRDQGRHAVWPWQLQAEVDFVEDDVTANVTMIAQQFGHDRTFNDFEEIQKQLFQTSGKKINIDNWSQVGGLFDYGYAATVHKFQGSQVDDVLLVAERAGPCTDDQWRRWQYTAITRAVKRITILE